MKQTPILFSTPMVAAIKAGRKTQTRRIMKLPPINPQGTDTGYFYYDRRTNCVSDGVRNYLDWVCPYGKPGDQLWVREAWRIVNILPDTQPGQFYTVQFKDFSVLPHPQPDQNLFKPLIAKDSFTKGETDMLFGKWRPSIFMPRWASRITLEILTVRVERLNDISEADVIAEGLAKLSKDGGQTFKFGKPDNDGLPGNDDHGWHWKEWETDPAKAFAKAWDKINGKRAPWASNPWVWALEFKII